MNLFERKGTLYIDYVECGKRVRRSLKLKDTKSNRAYAYRYILPKIEDRLKLNIPVDADLNIENYLNNAMEHIVKINTLKNYEFAIKRVSKFLQFKNIMDYSVIDFDLAVSKMRKAGMCDNTINRYFDVFKSAFNIAVRQGIIAKSPLILPKLNCKAKEKEAYDLFQVGRILSEAKGELKTFLYIAFFTGARTGEILGLTWGDIKNNEISINKNWYYRFKKIGTPKNGKSRDVMLLSPLKKYLATLKRGEDNEFVLKDRCSQKYLNNFKKLLKRLDYKVQSLHATRHTFISLCVSASIDLPLIQKMVGHSSSDMITKIYMHYIDDVSKKDKLEKAFDTSKAQRQSVS